MNTLTTVLAILVALEHLYIMFLETIATSSESTSRVFSISVDQLKSKTIATLLKNQGVYNGLIAVLLFVAVWQQDLLWTRLLLGYVILAALYGSLTSKPSIIPRKKDCSDLRREWLINNYYVLKLGSLEYFPYICGINIPITNEAKGFFRF